MVFLFMRFLLLTPHFSRLTNHLIRSLKHADGNCETDMFGRLEVYDKFELRCLLNGQVGRFGPFEDLVDVVGGAAEQVIETTP